MRKSRCWQAAKEFADTETMMKSAERMFGPYRFDRYESW